MSELKYQIKTGVRIVSVKYNAQSNVGFPVHWAHIFLDCIGCDQSIGLKFRSDEESEKMANEEAVKVFNANGWTVKPTRCPACVAQAEAQS